MSRIVSALALGLLVCGTGCASSGGVDADPWAFGPTAAGTPASRYVLAERVRPAEGPTEDNFVTVLAGGVSERGGGGFVLGGQYERRLDEKWGAGGFLDLAFGDDDFSPVIGGAFYWHPVDNVSLLAGPGVDLEADEFFVRLGGSYFFPVGDYFLGPAVYVDVAADDTPILGAVVFGRDF